MMLPYLTVLVAATATTAAAAAIARPTTLYATHYNGNIYTLHLHPNGSLTTDSAQKACGDMPSWLTLDSSTRTLYCSDESGSPSKNGSLTSLAVQDGGYLSERAKTVTPGGGVNSVIYTSSGGGKHLAIAHYEGAALSTFSLPIHPNQPPTQVFSYNLSDHGPLPQQDTPHSHEVIIDPTGSFLLVADLGSDLLRIYSIDHSSGTLEKCPDYEFEPGTGPRHGEFASDLKHPGKMLLYLDTELSGTVQVFDVSYPHPHHHHAQGKGNGKGGCLSLRRVQSMVPYPGQKMPDGATPSEIIVRGDSVYVSIRSDGGFDGKDGKGKSDSVATLGRSRNGGEVKVERLTSAYGTVPRTMVINKAGDLVAIGDQSSSEVVVVRRDVRTGRLGGKVAGIKVGEEGEVGTAQGLSSVIWGLE